MRKKSTDTRHTLQESVGTKPSMSWFYLSCAGDTPLEAMRTGFGPVLTLIDVNEDASCENDGVDCVIIAAEDMTNKIIKFQTYFEGLLSGAIIGNKRDKEVESLMAALQRSKNVAVDDVKDLAEMWIHEFINYKLVSATKPSKRAAVLAQEDLEVIINHRFNLDPISVTI